MSQGEFGATVGLKQGTISAIELGNSSPTPQLIATLVDRYGVDYEEWAELAGLGRQMTDEERLAEAARRGAEEFARAYGLLRGREPQEPPPEPDEPPWDPYTYWDGIKTALRLSWGPAAVRADPFGGKIGPESTKEALDAIAELWRDILKTELAAQQDPDRVKI